MEAILFVKTCSKTPGKWEEEANVKVGRGGTVGRILRDFETSVEG